MPLRGPKPADTTRICSEINQLVNQRFLLTVAAISAFGAVIAWLIPRSPPAAGDPLGLFIITGSILLLVILFLLYWYSHLLKGMTRILSRYLIETDSSCFEADWAAYRAQKNSDYWAYTKPQSVVFMAIGALAGGFPFVFAVAYHLQCQPLYGLQVLFIVTISYELLIWLMGFRYRWSMENDAEKRWHDLNSRTEMT